MREVDLVADLNAEDDDGFGWSTLADARDRHRITPGAVVLAGNQAARAVVRIVAVDDDGQVHYAVLPGASLRTATSSATPWRSAAAAGIEADAPGG